MIKEAALADHPESRVDLKRMRAEYEKWREGTASRPEGGRVTIRAVAIQSPAPAESVRRLIAHAERGCHAEQTFRTPIPVKTSAILNGQELPLG